MKDEMSSMSRAWDNSHLFEKKGTNIFNSLHTVFLDLLEDRVGFLLACDERCLKACSEFKFQSTISPS